MGATSRADGDDEPRERLLARAERVVQARLGKAAPALPLLLLLLVWAFLNAACNTAIWQGDPWYVAALVPSPDVLVVLGLLAALAFAGLRPSGLLQSFLVALLVLVRLAGVPDELMRLLWGRPFELAGDAALLWDAVALAEERWDMGTILGRLALVCGLGALVAFLARQALAIAVNTFAATWARAGFLGLALALLSLAALGVPVVGPFRSLRAGEHALAGARGDARLAEARQRFEAARQRAAHGPSTLGGLRSRHVIIVLVESLGVEWLQGGSGRSSSSGAAPSGAAPVRAALVGLGERLGAGGWHARAATLEVPDVSGISELAQASLLAGVSVERRSELALLRETSLAPLARAFRQTGYRTVRVLPGETRDRGERTDSFWGFEMDYYAFRLGYRGPPFGASPIPDQLVLDRLLRRELAQAEDPVFAVVALTGSQAPCDVVPPAIDDWEHLGDGEVFAAAEPERYEVTLPELEGARPACGAALERSLGAIDGLLTLLRAQDLPAGQRPGRRGRDRHGRGRRGRGRGRDGAGASGAPLVLVLGDHAPPAPLFGRPSPHLVPAFVTSADEDVLAPFAERAWTPGVVPAVGPALGATTDLRWLLTQAFGDLSDDGGEDGGQDGGPAAGSAADEALGDAGGAAQDDGE